MYPTEIPTDAKTIITHEGKRISYSVETTEPFAINAWNLDNPNLSGEPFWHQPHDLDGNAWPDKTTAQEFADNWMQNEWVNPPVVSTTPTSDEIKAAQAILTASGFTVTPASN